MDVQMISEIIALAIFLIPIALIILGIIALYKKVLNSGEKIKKWEINGNLMRDQFREKVFMDNCQWEEYRKLRNLLIDKDLLICPNVHVLRLTEPRDFKVKNKKLRRRLSEQYIDFVVCNRNMKVIALIRLLKADEQKGEEDLFNRYANAVLGTCNYKVIQTWSITPDILKKL